LYGITLDLNKDSGDRDRPPESGNLLTVSPDFKKENHKESGNATRKTHESRFSMG